MVGRHYHPENWSLWRNKVKNQSDRSQRRRDCSCGGTQPLPEARGRKGVRENPPPSLSLSTPQSSTRACFGHAQPERRNQRAQAKQSYSTLRAGHRRAEMCVGDTSGNPRGREDPAGQSSSRQPFWHQRRVSWKKTFSQTRGVGVVSWWFKHIIFTVHFISIIITSAPPQTIRH